jgi:hypothetical protein
MAKKLQKTQIITGNTVEAFHVSQSVDAFSADSQAAYDISVSGSFHVTGSTVLSGSVKMDIDDNYEDVDGLVLVLDQSNNTVFTTGSYGGSGTQGTQGLQGAQGLNGQGPQGLQGGQGVQGTLGLQGPIGTGTQGTQGPQSTLQGPQGLQGGQGLTGTSITGPQGLQGLQGGQGVQGNQGDSVQGAQGVQGLQGGQGVQGETVQGSQGLQGAQGLDGTGGQGPQGLQGGQGLTGTSITGPQGLQGLQGGQGVQGNQGETVQGAQGVQGAQSIIQGPQGGQGVQGNQGETVQGAQGVQGAQSTLQGPQGVQGNQGNSVQGAQGVQGNQGDSVQGSQGVQGNQGNSVQGAQGVQGAQSTLQGPQGVQGLQGVQGDQGETVQGSQGIQGIQGAEGSGGGGGGGTPYSQTIKYQAIDTTTVKILMKSSGNLWGGLTWSRSSTTLTVTHDSHGLSAGDYVLIRNMNVDYSYLEIQTASTNQFTLTVPATGGGGGTEGGYVVAFKAAFTENSEIAGDITSVTITMPSSALEASQQLESINISSTTQETDFAVTVPKGIASGAAGTATSITNFDLPTTTGIGGDSEPSNLSVSPKIASTDVNNGDFNKYTLANSGGSVGEATIIKMVF